MTGSYELTGPCVTTGQYEQDQKHRLGDREQAVILEPVNGLVIPVVTQGPVNS